MTVAAVILAAGGSARMGRPKQLLPVGGVSLAHRAGGRPMAASGYAGTRPRRPPRRRAAPDPARKRVHGTAAEAPGATASRSPRNFTSRFRSRSCPKTPRRDGRPVSYAPFALSAVVVLVNLAYSAHALRVWRRECRVTRGRVAGPGRRKTATHPPAAARLTAEFVDAVGA